VALLQGRANVIVEFCRGFAAGGLHQRLPLDYTPAYADGHASGRLSCRAAITEYLRERGFHDLKDQPLEDFLPDANKNLEATG